MFNLCDNSNLSAKLLKKNTNSKKSHKKHTYLKKIYYLCSQLQSKLWLGECYIHVIKLLIVYYNCSK